MKPIILSKKIKKLSCFSFFLASTLVSAQNLVPNGDFETFITCPDSLGQLSRADSWVTPTRGSSDYFNACFGNNCSITNGGSCLPCNALGCESAHSGDGYAGLITYADSSLSNFQPHDNYTEYLQTTLTSPLAAGQWYEVSFYVSAAELANVATEIQAYFSSTAITDTNFSTSWNYFTLYTPQISSSIPVTSNVGWTKVCGAFQATGGEQYLTIGLFGNKATQQVIPISNRNPSDPVVNEFHTYAYYYIDDVSVVAAEPLTNVPDIQNTFFCANDTAILTAPDGLYTYLWQDGATQDSLSIDDTLVVTDTGTYWLDISYACDQVTRQTFEVIPYDISLPNYSGTDTFCIGDTLQLEAFPYLSYTWDNGAIGPNILITEADTLVVTVTTTCETTEDTLEIAIKPLPSIDFGNDSIVCWGDTIQIGAIVPDAISYEWQDGSEDPFYTVTEPQTYSVLVTTDCYAETLSKTFESNCPCEYFIPNIFTPNEDGLNDVFRPLLNCRTLNYELRIFNEYGKLIFRSLDPFKGWDGTVKDAPTNTGTYVYYLNTTVIEGLEKPEQLIRATGNVTLIR